MPTLSDPRTRGSISLAAPLLLLLLDAGLAAQNPPVWSLWGATDGLLDSHTNSLVIDSQGNVWSQHGN